MPISIRIKRGTGGQPSQLLRGELAYDETNQRLYIGSGDSGANDANGLPIAQSIVELTTSPQVLEDLANISVGSGASDGDVLVYDSVSEEWVADALSIAWDDVTSKPASFTPSAHTHGSISDDGKIGSTAGLVVQTGASGAVTTLAAGTSGQVLKQGAAGLEWGTAGGVGTVTSVTAGTGLAGGEITSSGTIAVTYGTTAGTACEGDDGRLDDTRTPTDNTVSTAKLQDAAVTYAKIQDVSATDRILGRATAGAGDVEEITCTAAGRALLDDADAAAQRTTLGLGGAAEKAADFYAAASHTHAAADISSGTLDIARIPTGSTSSTVCIGDDARLTNDRNPTAHNHTVTLEISGFIESPEAKTYVISPAIPAAITITQLKAQTSAGTVDLAVHDDGTPVPGCSLADAGTTLASLASAISESVAAGSKLALVVSDLQSSPADLAFSVHYTVASANNA
jgi:hypothetical protein